MIRVLLCDGHPLVRQALGRLLAEAGDEIGLAGEAVDGEEALRLLREAAGDGLGFDVVLMDIALPYRDGLDLLPRLRAERPRLPVLMLSAFADKQYAVRSLKLGAAGCLPKTADGTQLLHAIRTVVRGGLWITPEVGAQLDGALQRQASRAPLREQLSPRAWEVFRLLTAGRTVGEIAALMEVPLQAVAECRAELLTLTGMRNDVELTLYAVREAGR